MDELMVEVEAAFVATSVDIPRWDDPHPPPDRVVADEEYSRVTDPAKWRIVGARADAWIDALISNGLARVERDGAHRWAEAPTPLVTRTDVVTPVIEGAVPLVLARSRIGDIPDAGLTIGVGDPAVSIALIPDCGCDACDSGSQDVIDVVDSYIRPVVTGEFRHVRRGHQSITVLEDGCREASNIGMGRGGDVRDGFNGGWFRYVPTTRSNSPSVGRMRGPRVRSRDRIDEILADPIGWDEVVGPSWLTERPSDLRH